MMVFVCVGLCMGIGDVGIDCWIELDWGIGYCMILDWKIGEGVLGMFLGDIVFVGIVEVVLLL